MGLNLPTLLIQRVNIVRGYEKTDMLWDECDEKYLIVRVGVSPSVQLFERSTAPHLTSSFG